MLILALSLVMSSCENQNQARISEPCNPAEMSIEVTVPAGTTNINSSPLFGESLPELTLNVQGAYVSRDEILTVAHGFPQRAFANGVTAIKRNDETELLLLRSEICGKPLPLAEPPIAEVTTVYDCTIAARSYAINETGITSFAHVGTRQTSKQLQNLWRIGGGFTQGDSGKPFCNANGELLAMLVAVDEVSALLIPYEQLEQFLN
jgi:hypothetical protein